MVRYSAFVGPEMLVSGHPPEAGATVYSVMPYFVAFFSPVTVKAVVHWIAGCPVLGAGDTLMRKQAYWPDGVVHVRSIEEPLTSSVLTLVAFSTLPPPYELAYDAFFDTFGDQLVVPFVRTRK